MSPVGRKLRGAAIALVLPLLSCSSFLILREPNAQDLSVLEPGTPRSAVVEVLGPIVAPFPDERCFDDFLFRPGTSAGKKAWMFPFGLALGVATMGMGEITFMEAHEARSKWRTGILVRYNEDATVSWACVYQGERLIRGWRWAPPTCPDWLLRLEECGKEEAVAD